MLEPVNVVDGVPSKEEIEWAVRRVHPNFSGDASCMQAGHLKSCNLIVRAEGKYDPSRWQIFLELVQMVFITRDLVMDLNWATAVIIPKGGGKYR